MDCGIGIRHKVDLERILLDASAKPTYLPLSLLQDITDCFSDDQQIGSGGFAVVYKGMVGKGMVAVKKLSRTFGMHADKFHKEVECLMKAKHKNIVRFLGYCSDTQERTANYEGKFVMAELRNWLLCFEYVPNGSLDKYITDAFCRLEWRERYKIITGICEGLLHLHEKRILHLDLKPANILLDDQLVPKIADFGLSRCLDKEQTGASTLNPCGSMGYLAPESFGGKLTFASDIYSLGVIIVEILTGEKGYPDDEDVVETWMNQFEGLDHWETRLEQVRVCIKIAMECMDSDPKKRPTARCINDRLEKMTSMVESGTNSSLVEQKVSFLEEQCSQVNIAELSSEYPGKGIKEHIETEELVEYVGTPIEVHWQQGLEEAPSDLWSSIWGAQDTERNVIPQGASLSSAITGALNKLNNLGIFDIKARMNYVRYGGPTLESIKCVKLFKKWELKPILKDKNFIRIDGFGEVYKSLVDNGSVTVRKLIGGIVLENEDFANEVIIQSQVIHSNIVRFIGCCLEFDVPILVYEFFCQDSLHEILHAKYKKPLSLSRRLSIAAASAKGLAYMHSMGSRKILHGDFKPANIFVDDNFMPKFSGFGMARLYGSGIVTGDITFMDPVYLRTGLLTKQSDVYSFGVVMLELVTGKEATCFDNNNLVRNFVENRKQGRISAELFDKEITVSGDLELLDNLAGIAMECLNHDPDLRPRMVDVAERLSMLNQPRRQAVS